MWSALRRDYSWQLTAKDGHRGSVYMEEKEGELVIEKKGEKKAMKMLADLKWAKQCERREVLEAKRLLWRLKAEQKEELNKLSTEKNCAEMMSDHAESIVRMKRK